MNNNLGNKINEIIVLAKSAMFEQGELAQLTYGALDIAAATMQSKEEDEITITYPIGYLPQKTPITSSRTYDKNQLLSRYQFLAFHQLSINAILQLVTVTETMLSDVIRAVISRYPQKLGGKRTIPIQLVLECSTIEEVHIRSIDILLNEISYKSPLEFAESMNNIISINLLECSAFHKYIEVKATRDIFVHNRGIANEIYVKKAGSHARVNSGARLPVDVQYFLESYESCLQLNEWLEITAHRLWHSSEYESRMTDNKEKSTLTPDD